jgi:hypothetical protein
MARRLRCVLVLAGLAVAGCGTHRGPVAAACTTGPAAILASLRAAPRNDTLSDGTRLSDCVSHAIKDSELQNVGATFIGAGDRLARTALTDDRSAYELGYLAGATARGASGTGGVATELVDRIDRMMGDAGGVPPARRAAFDRGRAAGRASG